MTSVTLVVTAKGCVPGRVKTRLVPPLTHGQAAEVARACLHDTLDAAERVGAARRILFWDGSAAAAEPRPGWHLVPQPPGPLDARLAALFDALAGPALLIGMDTPQIDDGVLLPALASWPADVDAWFGPAADGGFWALGLREPRGDLVRGVPMSRDDTGSIQHRRLTGAGLRVGLLDELTDVDDARSAQAVADDAPATRFARTWRAMLAEERP